MLRTLPALKRLALLLTTVLVLAALPARAAVEGRIAKLEINAVTRQRAAGFLSVRLPTAARGSKQSFTGEVTLGGVPIPFPKTMVVMVQPAAAGVDAVFLVELELARVGDPLLSQVGAGGLELRLSGALSGDEGSREPVRARGTLHLGSPEVVAPASFVPTFVRYGGARIAGISLTETEGEATVQIFNPLGGAIVIEEIRYQILVEDRKLADGVVQKVRLHPTRDNRIALPIHTRNADLLAAAGEIGLAGTTSGRLVATVALKVGGGRHVVPIDVAGNVNLLR